MRPHISSGAHQSSVSPPILCQAGNAAGGRSPPLRGRCRRSRQRGVTACDHRKKPGKFRPVSPAKSAPSTTFHPRPRAMPDTLPVPPSVTPVSVAGEAGPVPGGRGRDADRFSGAWHERSPSRLKQGGACLWGTHDWTGDWRGSPPAFVARREKQEQAPASATLEKAPSSAQRDRVCPAKDTERDMIGCHVI